MRLGKEEGTRAWNSFRAEGYSEQDLSRPGAKVEHVLAANNSRGPRHTPQPR